jgi:DNA-binding response OmpR family regulator
MDFYKETSTPEEVVIVLLVSPLEDDHLSLRRILDHSNWKLLETRSCGEAKKLLRENHAPVVICERNLPDGDWKTLLDELSLSPNPPRLIVSSRLADERLWAEALNVGCYDVLPTPYESEEVFRVGFLAWHSWKSQRERMSKSPAQAAVQKDNLWKAAQN